MTEVFNYIGLIGVLVASSLAAVATVWGIYAVVMILSGWLNK